MANHLPHPARHPHAQVDHASASQPTRFQLVNCPRSLQSRVELSLLESYELSRSSGCRESRCPHTISLIRYSNSPDFATLAEWFVHLKQSDARFRFPAKVLCSRSFLPGLTVSTLRQMGDACNSRRIQHLRRCGFGPWLAALSTLCNVLLRFVTNCVPDSVPSTMKLMVGIGSETNDFMASHLSPNGARRN